jgi:hypothetical protein
MVNNQIIKGERVNINFSQSYLECNTEDAIVLTESYSKMLNVKKVDGSDMFAIFRKVKMLASGEIKEVREDKIIRFNEVKNG